MEVTLNNLIIDSIESPVLLGFISVMAIINVLSGILRSLMVKRCGNGLYTRAG
jgi:hypothetical protein